MGRSKKPKAGVHRLSKIQSIPEKVQDAVKKAVMNNYSTVTIPSSLWDKSKANQRRNFTVQLAKYSILQPKENQEARLIKISDEIGIGAVSLTRINKGHIFDKQEFWGSAGRVIKEEDSIQKRSTMFDDMSNQYRLLNGPISMLNHSCLDHCNCVAVFAGKDSVDDFKILQAIKTIKPNTELTICYSEFSHLSCRMCK